MAYTQQMAQQYYETLPQSEKEKVDSSGGPSIEWFTNAVNAGVPDAVKATGKSRGVADQNEGYTGEMAEFSDAADASEWMGKRKPTPQELRKWAADQHARYVAGDTSAQDEDYERFDDRTLAGWINEKWDVSKGGFFSPNGERIGKPPDVDSQGVNAYGEKVGQGGAGQGGAGERQPAPPPPPTTFGNQLSMTGNPMQDMLIQQFNTGQNNSYGQGQNIFGLGEDRAPGGTGINADRQSQNVAQTLSGGGLWWGQGQDAFGGFRADQRNAEPGQGTQPQTQPSQPSQSGQNFGASPSTTTTATQQPQTQSPQTNTQSPVSDMMANQGFRAEEPTPGRRKSNVTPMVERFF